MKPSSPLQLIVVGIVLSVVTSAARSQYTVDTLSGWGGSVLGFQRAGNVGYCGSGQRFVSLNMSNDASIHELSSVIFTGIVQDLVVRGQYAYVALSLSTTSLAVVDISNPASLQVVWTETIPALATSGVRKVRTYNDRLYILHTSGQIVTYELSDPAAPVAFLFPDCGNSCYGIELPRPTTSDPDTSVDDFEVVGDLMYIGCNGGANQFGGSGALRVYSLMPDPRYPVLVGSCTLGTNSTARTRRLSISGNIAIVSVQISSAFPVRIVDVTTPANPTLVGGYDDLFHAYGVALHGTLAFVADWYHSPVDPHSTGLDALKGLAVLDIAEPANPTLIGTYNTEHSSICDVRVAGNRAYVMCEGQGLEVLDISNATSPTRIGGYFSPGALRQMTMEGNRLYVADMWNGFLILDVSNANTPSVLGVYHNVDDIRHQNNYMVAVSGNVAYLAAGYGGIQFVDVSSPVSPTFLAQYQGSPGWLSPEVYGIELVGSVLHTCQSRFEGSLSCSLGFPPEWVNYDLSADPLSPVAIGHGCFGSTPSSKLVTRSGVMFRSRQPSPINVMNPAAPIELPEFTTRRCDDMYIDGSRLYVVDGSSGPIGGFSIVDIASPLAPSVTGFAHPSNNPTLAVAASGDVAFATSASRLYVMDVADPSSPQLVVTSRTGGGTNLLADTSSGSRVLYSTSMGRDPTYGNGAEEWGGLLIRRFRCRADFNGVGGISVQDIFDFLNAWFSGAPAADFNGVGGISVQDIFDYLNAWFTGCDL